MKSGYGLSNVNQRIRLYYGPEYGLVVESEYQRGTCVSLIVPLQRAPAVRAAVALDAG